MQVSEICKTVPENPLADFEGYIPPGAKSPKKTVKYEPPKMNVDDTKNNKKVEMMNTKRSGSKGTRLSKKKVGKKKR